MSFKDIFKKSFLEGFASTEITSITVVVALAVLVTGILMDVVYRLADPGVGWGGDRT